MNSEIKYLSTTRNPMNSNNAAYLATIDDHRRIWGITSGNTYSFYIINGDEIHDVHLTPEATEALRIIIERLQSDSSFIGYSTKISTQAHSPKKKTPVATKKAGSNRKIKRPSLAKKKKK